MVCKCSKMASTQVRNLAARCGARGKRNEICNSFSVGGATLLCLMRPLLIARGAMVAEKETREHAFQDVKGIWNSDHSDSSVDDPRFHCKRKRKQRSFRLYRLTDGSNQE